VRYSYGLKDEQSFNLWLLTIAYVHGYFKAETHFGHFWFGPHDKSPLVKLTVQATGQLVVPIAYRNGRSPYCALGLV